MEQQRSKSEEERMRRLVLRSKSSRVYPVRNDTGQAKPLRETRKYRTTGARRHGGVGAALSLRPLRRRGEIRGNTGYKGDANPSGSLSTLL